MPAGGYLLDCRGGGGEASGSVERLEFGEGLEEDGGDCGDIGGKGEPSCGFVRAAN